MFYYYLFSPLRSLHIFDEIMSSPSSTPQEEVPSVTEKTAFFIPVFASCTLLLLFYFTDLMTQIFLVLIGFSSLLRFHFISFYFILFHFISFYFILFHFISFYFILFHFISFYFILFHLNRTHP